MKTISVDAMGGDFGPMVTVPSVLSFLAKHQDVRVILVGQSKVLGDELKRLAPASIFPRVEVVHASEVVASGESPSKALRNKKDSSMRIAINQVKDGRAGACVSAGNTGALMATARFVLKMLPGLDRPAIVSTLPTHGEREVRMLDLGANVDCSEWHLYQFAIMGSMLAAAIESLDAPKVALLNIGEESIKGNEQVQKTAELLQKSSMNYVGFVEGNDVFSGDVDVVVCDGFVGNIALKTCEGVAKLIAKYAREIFKKDLLSRAAAVPAAPLLKRLGKRLDPRLRNGATFLGVDGIVVKSHGGADEVAFEVALEEAVRQLEKDVPNRIRAQVAKAMSEVCLN